MDFKCQKTSELEGRLMRIGLLSDWRKMEINEWSIREKWSVVKCIILGIEDVRRNKKRERSIKKGFKI